MTNYMPLIHQARRTRDNHLAGNPFANAYSIQLRIDELTDAYARCDNAKVCQLIKVELDLLETLI